MARTTVAAHHRVPHLVELTIVAVSYYWTCWALAQAHRQRLSSHRGGSSSSGAGNDGPQGSATLGRFQAARPVAQAALEAAAAPWAARCRRRRRRCRGGSGGGKGGGPPCSPVGPAVAVRQGDRGARTASHARLFRRAHTGRRERRCVGLGQARTPGMGGGWGWGEGGGGATWLVCEGGGDGGWTWAWVWLYGAGGLWVSSSGWGAGKQPPHFHRVGGVGVGRGARKVCAGRWAGCPVIERASGLRGRALVPAPGSG